jgi:hypothetical protein
MKPESDFEAERRSLGEGPSESRRALQRVRLLREARPLARQRWVLIALATMVAVTVAAFALRPRQTEWVTERGASVVVGSLIVAETARELEFSDGSNVTLESGSKLLVEAVDEQHVEVRLEEGHLDAHVMKGTGRTWRYRAGPWTVRVVGTRLAITWTPSREALEVSVSEGAVEVSGPSGAPVLVHAGESISRSPPAPQPRVEAPVIAPPPQESSPKKKLTVVQATPPVVEQLPEAPPPAPPVTWRELLAQGQRAQALEDATARGVFAGALDDADALVLADAARLERRVDLAQVLLARVLERGGPNAAEASFLLGRFELEAHRARAAQEFFSRSLSLAPRGAFAEQSRGRLLEVLLELRDVPAARLAAKDYLVHHPGGAWEQLATRLSQGAAP